MADDEIQPIESLLPTINDQEPIGQWLKRVLDSLSQQTTEIKKKINESITAEDENELENINPLIKRLQDLFQEYVDIKGDQLKVSNRSVRNAVADIKRLTEDLAASNAANLNLQGKFDATSQLKTQCDAELAAAKATIKKLTQEKEDLGQSRSELEASHQAAKAAAIKRRAGIAEKAIELNQNLQVHDYELTADKKFLSRKTKTPTDIIDIDASDLILLPDKSISSFSELDAKTYTGGSRRRRQRRRQRRTRR